MTSIREIIENSKSKPKEGYNFAFIEENSKREVRRKILKAVAIPGYQVPFGSSELPISKGWGTGALQITLSLLKPDDIVKVFDNGFDDGVNAVNIKRLIETTTNIKTTVDTTEATIVQTRHRIPEEKMTEDQILVLQVPYPDPLMQVGIRSESKARRMHAEEDYSVQWISYYEDIVRWGEITLGFPYPVKVNDRYIMCASPIPRWDVHKFNMADSLFLFGAGRERRIYAVPPYTKVKALEFEDYKFETEDFKGAKCKKCGSTDTYLDVWIEEDSSKSHACNDTSFCNKLVSNQSVGERW